MVRSKVDSAVRPGESIAETKAKNDFHEIGYDHGLNGVDLQVGEKALEAEASVKWRELEACLSKTKLETASLKTKIAAEEKHLLKSFGRHKVSRLRWIEVFAIYPLVGLIAILAEVPLAGVTFAQSAALGTGYEAPLGPFTVFAFYALVLATPLVGFAFELTVSALHDRRDWKSTLKIAALPLVTLILSTLFIVGYARLRGGISEQSAATANFSRVHESAALPGGPIGDQATKTAQSARPNESSDLEQARAEADTANKNVSKLSLHTFEYLTYTLYCLFGSCVVLFFHKYSEYKLHNLALKSLMAIESPYQAAAQELTKLESFFIDAAGDPKPIATAAEDFKLDALARYRAGMSRGTLEKKRQFDKLPLFTRLQLQHASKGVL